MILVSDNYGIGDSSYKAVGELDGLVRLVDTFYDLMDDMPESKTIRDMHPKSLVLSRKKLVYFLSGWLGGPRLYQEHFGGISIPASHMHLTIGYAESDAWIGCMFKAVEQQPYEPEFKIYLIEQLRFPAERIRQVCSDH